MQIPYFQVSLIVCDPSAALVNERLGSDSQVVAPLNLRMYLYSNLVLAGTVTVTVIVIVITPWSAKLESKVNRRIGRRTTPDGVVGGVESNSVIR